MGVHFWASQVSLSRVSIKVDMLICWLSESSLLVWILEVSLIVTIKVRAQSPRVWLSKDLIIKHESLIIKNNQVFHHVSPNFSNSADDSPDQTWQLTEKKSNILFAFSVLSRSTTHHPDCLWLWLKNGSTGEKNCFEIFEVLTSSHYFSWELVMPWNHTGDHRTVAVPRRNTHLRHCRT